MSNCQRDHRLGCVIFFCSRSFWDSTTFSFPNSRMLCSSPKSGTLNDFAPPGSYPFGSVGPARCSEVRSFAVAQKGRSESKHPYFVLLKFGKKSGKPLPQLCSLVEACSFLRQNRHFHNILHPKQPQTLPVRHLALVHLLAASLWRWTSAGHGESDLSAFHLIQNIPKPILSQSPHVFF